MSNPANDRPSITPEIRIADLLRAYPELEDFLVDVVPAFARLRNPVLRKTVARVASLRQAAVVGKVDLGWLVSTLRRRVGDVDSLEVRSAVREPGSCPEWCRPDRPDTTVDVRPLLGAGQQPIGRVLSDLKQLAPGQVLMVIAPFVPMPLIDKGAERGLGVWWRERTPDKVEVFFHRPVG